MRVSENTPINIIFGSVKIKVITPTMDQLQIFPVVTGTVICAHSHTYTLLLHYTSISNHL